MKDGAALNQAALRQVKFYFSQLLDVTCFLHTIDNVGKHFDKFAQYWVRLFVCLRKFSHSPAAGLAWRNRTGKALQPYSPTWWWSRWEVMKQVMDFYGGVEPFFNRQWPPFPCYKNASHGDASKRTWCCRSWTRTVSVGRCRDPLCQGYLLSWRGWPSDIQRLGKLIYCCPCCSNRCVPKSWSSGSPLGKWERGRLKSTCSQGKGVHYLRLTILSKEVCQEFYSLVRVSARLCCPV